MKLRIVPNETGPKFTCVDESAPDAELIGHGDTEQAAKDDFLDKWVDRECRRDLKNALSYAQSWDSMIAKLFGDQP